MLNLAKVEEIINFIRKKQRKLYEDMQNTFPPHRYFNVFWFLLQNHNMAAMNIEGKVFILERK